MSEALLNNRIAISKEKSADEMFEELGYSDVQLAPYGIEYRWLNYEIYFSFLDKTYVKTDWEDEEISFTIAEHKAIHKKMQELGWIG